MMSMEAFGKDAGMSAFQGCWIECLTRRMIEVSGKGYFILVDRQVYWIDYSTGMLFQVFDRVAGLSV